MFCRVRLESLPVCVPGTAGRVPPVTTSSAPISSSELRPAVTLGHKGNRQRKNGGWMPLHGGQPANTDRLRFLSTGSPRVPLPRVWHGGRAACLFLAAHLKGEETGAHRGARSPHVPGPSRPDGRNHVPWTMRSPTTEIRLPTSPHVRKAASRHQGQESNTSQVRPSSLVTRKL